MMARNDSKLTIAILTRNSGETLERTLEAVENLGEILVVDDESTDNTLIIAQKYQATVLAHKKTSFAEMRNLALEAAKTEWIFYVDADEVVTLKLKAEISRVVYYDTEDVFRVKRQNFFLGKRFYDDRVERLFRKNSLKQWKGAIHESPIFDGVVSELLYPLNHYTHRDMASMMTKTNEWSEIEADLRIQAKHPPVVWWRLLRIALTVWWEQLTIKKVWRYGRAGWFEGYFQMVDKLIVYTKLWERQQRRT